MNNQTDVNFEQILEAALSIKGHAHNTPVLTNGAADALTQAQLYFKCENLQRTGSFKFKGAQTRSEAIFPREANSGVFQQNPP